VREIIVKDLSRLPAAAEQLLAEAGENRIFLFYAEMGAGKTTLIKTICKQLGVQENVSSPTFSIVNEYESPSGPIYHFDFYRLKHEQEAYDLGYEEYFYSGNYCFVEWPEKIENLLPEDAISITMNGNASEERRIVMNISGKTDSK